MIEKFKEIQDSEHKVKFLSGFFVVGIFLAISYYGAPLFLVQDYKAVLTNTSEEKSDGDPVWRATHIDTPASVKGIYMTSWVAGTPSIRQGIIDLIEETELNSIIIDIKDDTGKISFKPDNPDLLALESYEERIPDLKELIESLHKKNIYVIGRVAVFQDPFMTKARPELAVQKNDGSVWKDRKGLSFIDVGAKDHWDYIIMIAKDAYNQGFDEINFDYIRFPSDGQMTDIYFPFSEDVIVADPINGKAKQVKNFFAYLDRSLSDTGMVTSADLFGMTTTNTDDLNIGQILEYAMPYFDYIAPMVYPSHYPKGFYGYQDVNAVPYEIIKISMGKAVERVNAFKAETASTTPNASFLPRLRPNQMRPWLQDNDYPVHYTPEMVRAQIQATYDVGLNSWMLWDAANTYTRAALEKVPLTNQE